jgi:hypothetical protein
MMLLEYDVLARGAHLADMLHRFFFVDRMLKSETYRFYNPIPAAL